MEGHEAGSSGICFFLTLLAFGREFTKLCKILKKPLTNDGGWCIIYFVAAIH